MKYPVNNISQECKTALKSQFRIFYIGHSHGQSNIDSVTAGDGKIFHIWYSFFLPFLIKQFWNLSHLICNLLENWSPCLYHQASANTWELMNIYSTKTKFVPHSKTPAQHLFILAFLYKQQRYDEYWFKKQELKFFGRFICLLNELCVFRWLSRVSLMQLLRFRQCTIG